MAVAFRPDGKTVATGGMDGLIKERWDAAGQPRNTLKGHLSWVNGLAFSPDGNTLASHGSDNMLRLWDVASGTEKKKHPRQSGRAADCVAFSPDSKRIAAGTRYGLVKVWDAQSGNLLQTLQGHAGDVWTIAFSPDGKTLASRPGDCNRPGPIRLWDTSTWKARTSLKHTNEVLSLAFSPNGRFLAAGAWDKDDPSVATAVI